MALGSERGRSAGHDDQSNPRLKPQVPGAKSAERLRDERRVRKEKARRDLETWSFERQKQREKREEQRSQIERELQQLVLSSQELKTLQLGTSPKAAPSTKTPISNASMGGVSSAKEDHLGRGPPGGPTSSEDLPLSQTTSRCEGRHDRPREEATSLHSEANAAKFVTEGASSRLPSRAVLPQDGGPVGVTPPLPPTPEPPPRSLRARGAGWPGPRLHRQGATRTAVILTAATHSPVIGEAPSPSSESNKVRSPSYFSITIDSNDRPKESDKPVLRNRKHSHISKHEVREDDHQKRSHAPSRLKRMLHHIKKRQASYVPLPKAHCLRIEDLFTVRGAGAPDAPFLPDLGVLETHFLEEGCLEKSCVEHVVSRARQLVALEPNVIRLPAPVRVIGDIHGQFYDMVNMFKIAGRPGIAPYVHLFLGDYVDRGMFSSEVIIMVLCFKIRYPGTVFLLRGNHETRAMTEQHNFQHELVSKYGPEMIDLFMELFDHLPLAAVVETKLNGRFFCSHAGISPAFTLISELDDVDRVMEPPDDGVTCDLIWSDPVESSHFYNQNFSRNKNRGCSVVYGMNVLVDFLEANDCVAIVRSHQVVEEGYRCHEFKEAPPKYAMRPLVYTVFSAPNYCDFYENKGAYMHILDDAVKLNQTTAVKHPYVMPSFSNCVAFTVPFLLLRLVQNLYKILAAKLQADVATPILMLLSQRIAELSKITAQLTAKLAPISGGFVCDMSLLTPDLQRALSIIQNMRKDGGGGSVAGRLARTSSDVSDLLRMGSNRFKLIQKIDNVNEASLNIGGPKTAAWQSANEKKSMARGQSFRF